MDFYQKVSKRLRQVGKEGPHPPVEQMPDA